MGASSYQFYFLVLRKSVIGPSFALSNLKRYFMSEVQDKIRISMQSCNILNNWL